MDDLGNEYLTGAAIAWALFAFGIGSISMAKTIFGAGRIVARWCGTAWRNAAARQERIEILEEVCGEAYQVLGALNGPLRMLDNLAAAAQGKVPPHITCLPFTPDVVPQMATRRRRSARKP